MSGEHFQLTLNKSPPSVMTDELYAEAETVEKQLSSSAAGTLKGPNRPPATPSATVTSADWQNDDSDTVGIPGVTEYVAAVKTRPKQCAFVPQAPTQEYPLPDGWRGTLPKADHAWVSRALFKYSTSGKVEIDKSKLDRLWYHPPQPSLTCNQPPCVDRYFASKLLVWMPRRLWRCQLYCPQQLCVQEELIACGIYPRVRQVLDVEGFYSLAAEYLECRRCKRKVISWSSGILHQLDVSHRRLFRPILTYRYACDVRVVRLLRNRGLGNSVSQLRTTLSEQHGEAWLDKVNHYFADCQVFLRNGTLVERPDFTDPPVQVPMPTAQWFNAVYLQDVLQRLDEVKAAITYTFGRILKVDSTKKIVRKLAGHAAGTAACATDVGNEYGQVLMCVLTSGEECGLDKMFAGLVQRYKDSEVPPPEVLYVGRDWDCCTTRQSPALASWPDLHVCLDVWHFMRRIASGCTTDAHPLYQSFLGRVSECIFHWDKEDLDRLLEAKRQQMMDAHIPNPSYDDVMRNISHLELARHCRRSTRGVEMTTLLLSRLLEVYGGVAGRDTLGVPLLDQDRMATIWESQKCHIPCIQDPAGVQLYTKIGCTVKGGIELPVYRCARGSTSLKSFHRHLKQFIPGTAASDTHFQAYLLEGLVRWNEDRYMATIKSNSTRSEPRVYSSLVRHTANTLSQSIIGRAVCSNFVHPGKYTGELIGVEYLYNQTGCSLQTLLEVPEDNAEERDEVDEGIKEDDNLDPQLLEVDITVSLFEDNIPSPAATTSTQHASSSDAAAVSTRTHTHRLVPQCTYTPSCVPPPLSVAHFRQPHAASLSSSSSSPSPPQMDLHVPWEEEKVLHSFHLPPSTASLAKTRRREPVNILLQTQEPRIILPAPGPSSQQQSKPAPGPSSQQQSKPAPGPSSQQQSKPAPGPSSQQQSKPAPGPSSQQQSKPAPGPSSQQQSKPAPGPSSQQQTNPFLPQPSVPATTLYYRKRRAEEEKKLGVPLKRNQRHVEIYTCRQCGMHRKPESHKQYYGLVLPDFHHSFL